MSEETTTETTTVRLAAAADLEAIMRLHEADALGGTGDAWSAETEPTYRAAFARLSETPGHALYVAEQGGAVVGTFILSLLPGLTGHGALRAELRSVQVAPSQRSQGIGRRMVAEAERLAREAGAAVLELTSNLRRVDAHRFYEREGFSRSHAGFKKRL